MSQLDDGFASLILLGLLDLFSFRLLAGHQLLFQLLREFLLVEREQFFFGQLLPLA